MTENLQPHENERHERLQQIDEKIREEKKEIGHDEEKLEHDKTELHKLEEERREILEHERHGHHHHHHHAKLVCLKFIINGKPQQVDARPESTLKEAVDVALRESGNTGRPVDAWSVRWNNQVLDLNKKVEDFRFPECVELFLSLNAGQGGNE